MASGGEKISASDSVKGSDYIFEHACGPCEKEGHTNEAINFCVDCAEYVCLACTNHHQKFTATSGHTIVDRTLAAKVGGAPQSSSLLPSEVCRDHRGERITTYCKDHDLVLCNTCVSVGHRLCGGVEYIPDVAGGSKDNKTINKIKRDISKCINEVSQTQLSLQNLLATADDDKNEHLKRIHDCTQHLIKHARDLEKAAVNDVNGCHTTTTDRIRSDIKDLDDAEMTMKERLKNLDNVKGTSDAQVFVDLNRGRQEVGNARQLKQNLKSALAGKAKPEFVVNDDVKYFPNKVHALGQYVQKKVYKATLYGEYDVEMSRDKVVSYISGSCELPDGTILIADFLNNSLKKLDTSFQITAHLKMPYPADICQTGDDEVAVTLTFERKVQFVKVEQNKLKMTRSFKVSDGCRGIMCSRDELFVSCGGWPGNKTYDAEGLGFLGVYSMSGSLLRKIQHDHRGQQIFSQPRRITSTDNGNKIHIADRYRGLKTIDRQGHVLSTFAKGLKDTIGVCAVIEGNLLVCGYDSNNVIQINSDDTMVTQLLGEEDGIKEPMSLLFMGGSSRLLVTEDKSHKIKVFSLVL